VCNPFENVSIPKRVSEALKLKSPCGQGLHRSRNPVSIPKRVSEALKPQHIPMLREAEGVSIPKRVSEALKLLP